MRQHCKINTFWNTIRVDRGVSLEEVGQLVGVSTGKAGSWFTGQHKPDEHTQVVLCNFFDVDQKKGKAEFDKAYKEYHERKHGKKTEPAPTPATNNVFEMVYGVLSYAEFNEFSALCSGKEGDPLELIYGKVDLETFTKIANIIKGV